MGNRWVGIALVFVCALAGEAAAQAGYETATLSGSVTTNSDVIPPWVHVRATILDGTNASVSTNTNSLGEYSLQLPVGTYRVDAVYENMPVGSVTLSLTAGTTPTHHFQFAAGYLGATVTRDGVADQNALVMMENIDPIPGCGAPNATCDGGPDHCFCTLDTGRQYSCHGMSMPDGGQCHWAMPFWAQANTDSTGLAQRLVPAGLYKLTVGSSSPGPSGPMDPMTNQHGWIVIGSEPSVSVADTATVVTGPYPYQTATVTGQVLHNGEPFGGVTIFANAGPSGNVSTWVDATGMYTLRLPTLATYTISALQDGNAVIGSHADVSLLPGETHTLDFTLTGQYLSGTVVADGAAAAGAPVYITQHAPSSCAEADSCTFNDPEAQFCHCEKGGQQFSCHTGASGSGYCYWNMGGMFSAYTDSAGAFNKLLPPGTYDIQVMSAQDPMSPGMPGMHQWGSVRVGSFPGVVIDAAPIALSPVIYSTGTVAGEATSCGIPLRNVAFELRSPLGSVSTQSWSMTDSSYSLRAPHGDYTLMAQLQNVPVGTTPMTISDTAQQWSVNYDLGSLRGVILRDGLPSTNSPVTVTELPVGLACAPMPTCEMYEELMSFCHGCRTSTGRRYWCDANGCRFEMPGMYWVSTSTDGAFTVDVPPARWRVVAFSGSSDPGDPMGGGQSGGIVVGTWDVDVTACYQTLIDVQATTIEASSTETTVTLGGTEVPLLSLTFETVEAGTVSVTSTSTPPPDEETPPFLVAGVYYDITVPSFTGEVKVCLPYDADTSTSLSVWHRDNTTGEWSELPSTIEGNFVCAYTTSFSWYALGARVVTEPEIVLDGPIADLVADSSCNGHASLSATGGTGTYTWLLDAQPVGTGPSLSLALPLGANTITVQSGARTASTTIHVVDTTPPSIRVAPSPSVLWPPNGKLVPIAANATVGDNCDTSPSLTVLRATSPTATPTDMATTNTAVTLRAFRRGNELQGRMYTIEYSASDDTGNRATASGVVTVPHDMR